MFLRPTILVGVKQLAILPKQCLCPVFAFDPGFLGQTRNSHVHQTPYSPDMVLWFLVVFYDDNATGRAPMWEPRYIIKILIVQLTATSKQHIQKYYQQWMSWVKCMELHWITLNLKQIIVGSQKISLFPPGYSRIFFEQISYNRTLQWIHMFCFWWCFIWLTTCLHYTDFSPLLWWAS